MNTFAQNATIFNANIDAPALDWAPSQEVDGDRWVLVPSMPEHADCLESIADDLPGSEWTEPTPDIEEDGGPTWEQREAAALLLDPAGRYLLPDDPTAAADYWDARLAQYDAWHDSLPDEEFAGANCYPPRSLCL